MRSPRGPQHRRASAPLQPTHLSALGCETEPCRSRPPPRSGAAQTEPSPRSRSGGSDYCGAQELTAASCGNYCCDGEAAAALHRARRHGVRPRGGSAWSPGGRTDGEEGKRGLGGARAALGSRPGVARFQPHILLVLYRGRVLQLCTVSEKGMLGSAVLCPFRFGEPTYCPAWRHLTAR